MTGRNEGATAIPIQALVVRDVPKKDKKAASSPEGRTGRGGLSVKNGKLAFEKVETGLAGELMIEVKKGPAVGQEIVTGPFKVAAPGQGRGQGRRREGSGQEEGDAGAVR